MLKLLSQKKFEVRSSLVYQLEYADSDFLLEICLGIVLIFEILFSLTLSRRFHQRLSCVPCACRSPYKIISLIILKTYRMLSYIFARSSRIFFLLLPSLRAGRVFSFILTKRVQLADSRTTEFRPDSSVYQYAPNSVLSEPPVEIIF